MAADHLAGDGLGHVREGELPDLFRHAGVVDDLEQQVAQLVLEGGEVGAPADGVGDLVRLLNRIRRDGGEVLNPVPGAAIRGAQPCHDGEQARQGVFRARHGQDSGFARRPAALSRPAASDKRLARYRLFFVPLSGLGRWAVRLIAAPDRGEPGRAHRRTEPFPCCFAELSPPWPAP
jgi:hypothetical protein